MTHFISFGWWRAARTGALALGALAATWTSACKESDARNGGDAGGTGGTSHGAAGRGGSAGVTGGAGRAGGGGAGRGGAAGAGGAAGGGGKPAAGPDGGGGGTSGSRDAGPPVPGTFCSAGAPCRVMPLGDSITFGQNSSTGGGYRVGLFRRAQSAHQLLTFVGSQSSGPDAVDGAPFSKANEGHPGWTIGDDNEQSRPGLYHSVGGALSDAKPNIVLLHIGTNDIIFETDWPQMNARLEALLDRIQQNAPHALLVVAKIIPVAGKPPFDDAANRQTQAFNAGVDATVAKRRAQGENIATVDMWTPFATSANYGALAGDGWHPSDAGYDVMAKVWHDAIAAYLPKAP